MNQYLVHYVLLKFFDCSLQFGCEDDLDDREIYELGEAIIKGIPEAQYTYTEKLP